MSAKRMFSMQIIDSDPFLDMPLSAQALYFHLSMRADDDGFVNNPRKIQRLVNASDDDLKLLIAKRFILTFDSGVIVIKHWLIHNYIQKDRYHETVYTEEKSMLSVKDNKAYTLSSCTQNVDKLDTENRQVETKVVEVIEEKKTPSKRFVPPTVDEVRAYCEERKNNVDADSFVSFYESKGWMVGKNKMKDWKACVRTWERSRKNSGSAPAKKNSFNSHSQRQYDTDEIERMFDI